MPAGLDACRGARGKPSAGRHRGSFSRQAPIDQGGRLRMSPEREADEGRSHANQTGNLPHFFNP